MFLAPCVAAALRTQHEAFPTFPISRAWCELLEFTVSFHEGGAARDDGLGVWSSRLFVNNAKIELPPRRGQAAFD